MKKSRVVIAMSGGVDSSVAAALLVQQGYDVIGMMLQLWSETGQESHNKYGTPDAILQAKKVASSLNIPFYAVDAQSVFHNCVVKPFLQSYMNGATPNPCLICNREVRWGYLLDQALAIDCDYLATGHYVRLEQNAKDQFFLKRGLDNTKDQSYVLHLLNQKQLSHSLFPLGNFTKSQVRQLAKEFNLPVVDNEESQDICFINDDYRIFITRHACEKIEPGDIINIQGEVLGKHSGLPYYTIGQRKGLGISSLSPYYVIKKDVQNNTLIIGNNEQRAKKDLYASQVNWISGEPPKDIFKTNVMVRYRTNAKPCIIHTMAPDRVYVKFDTPINDISPGQAAVFYDDDVCLGGGTIQ